MHDGRPSRLAVDCRCRVVRSWAEQWVVLQRTSDGVALVELLPGRRDAGQDATCGGCHGTLAAEPHVATISRLRQRRPRRQLAGLPAGQLLSRTGRQTLSQ